MMKAATLQSEVKSKNTKPFFRPAVIQPKLTIGQPNDKYEQEADAMADRVMRMPIDSFISKANDNIQPFQPNNSQLIQRQAVSGRPATRSELEAEPHFNWRLEETNLSAGGNRPFIEDGIMVSGMGYTFGLRFASNCSQSLVQSVQTNNTFFNSDAATVGGYGNQFMELFRIDNGQAAGIDVHSHPMPSPRYLESQGIRGTSTHCMHKNFQICCGNYGGFVLPRDERYARRRYNPQNFNCAGPTNNYQIDYCTNGRDYSLRVSEFGINVISISSVPRRGGVLASINFTIELQERLDRYGEMGYREVERLLIIGQRANQFVQTNGINGAEVLFYARGDVSLAGRYLPNLSTIRQQYNTCMQRMISRPERTAEQWSEFVKIQLTRPNSGLCGGTS